VDSVVLPESIRTIWAVAQKPCEFCENGGECDAQLCRKNIDDVCGGRPVSTTLYPRFSPLQKDAFAYCDSYKGVVESEAKPRAADTLFFPAFLRLAKLESGGRFRNIDVDLVLKAICCIHNHETNTDFSDYAEVLNREEYRDFSEYLVYWSRESQKSQYHTQELGGYRTDLLMNMAVMLYNLLQLIQPTFSKVKEALANTVDLRIRDDNLAIA